MLSQDESDQFRELTQETSVHHFRCRFLENCSFSDAFVIEVALFSVKFHLKLNRFHLVFHEFALSSSALLPVQFPVHWKSNSFAFA